MVKIIFSFATVVMVSVQAASAHDGPIFDASSRSGYSIDGDISDWDESSGWQILQGRSGGSAGAGTKAEYAVAYNSDNGFLYVAVQAVNVTETRPTIEVFLDVEHGLALDRPAQYTLSEELNVAQARHASVAEAAGGHAGLMTTAEFRFDLKALGFNSKKASAVIGFGLNVKFEKATVSWPQSQDKWLNRRRLGDIVLPERTLALYEEYLGLPQLQSRSVQ